MFFSKSLSFIELKLKVLFFTIVSLILCLIILLKIPCFHQGLFFQNKNRNHVLVILKLLYGLLLIALKDLCFWIVIFFHVYCGNFRDNLVFHLVPASVWQPRTPSTYLSQRAAVHQRKHSEHVCRNKATACSMGENTQVHAGVVYWYYNIWAHLGSLYLHRTRTQLHG